LKTIKSKNILFISLLINLAGLLFLIYKLYFSYYIPYLDRQKIPEYSTSTSYWLNRNEYFTKLESIDTSSIILLGDSHFMLYNQEEHFKNPQILNRGIVGDNVNGVYHRLDQVLPYKPKKIILLVGINDIVDGFLPEETLKIYSIILHEISKKSPNTEIHVLSILPADRLVYHRHIHVKSIIPDFNSKLKKICEKNSVFYHDLYSSFEDPKSGLLRQKLSIGDGLHLNHKGYEVLTSILTEIVGDTVEL
jgi:lysophospholipase L1-like esterase